MKLNNKGFAVTTALYGVLIMATLVVSIWLANLSNTKKSSSDLIKTIENELNECVTAKTC